MAVSLLNTRMTRAIRSFLILPSVLTFKTAKLMFQAKAAKEKAAADAKAAKEAQK